MQGMIGGSTLPLFLFDVADLVLLREKGSALRDAEFGGRDTTTGAETCQKPYTRRGLLEVGAWSCLGWYGLIDRWLAAAPPLSVP